MDLTYFDVNKLACALRIAQALNKSIKAFYYYQIDVVFCVLECL